MILKTNDYILRLLKIRASSDDAIRKGKLVIYFIKELGLAGARFYCRNYDKAKELYDYLSGLNVDKIEKVVKKGLSNHSIFNKYSVKDIDVFWYQDPDDFFRFIKEVEPIPYST